MDTLNLLMSSMPPGFWQSIIGWFLDWVGTYMWTIIVFTIALKIVMLPLDFYQKKITRNNTQKQAIMKPELDKINGKYKDKNELNQKTMELYKKYNYNVMGSCFGMLINMVLTMVIFFSLFGAMNAISQFKIKNEYMELKETYIVEYQNFLTNYPIENGILYEESEEYLTAYDEAYDEYVENPVEGFDSPEEYAEFVAKEPVRIYAQNLVVIKFENIKEEWLWVKNVFRPDTNASTFPNYEEFKKISSSLYEAKYTDGDPETPYYYEDINGNLYLNLEAAQVAGQADFEAVTGKLQLEYGSWNGYYILVLLAASTTMLSQLLMNLGTKAKNKKGEEVKAQQVNKVMLFVLPAIMIFFTISSSAAFSVYITVSGLLGAIFSYLMNILMNKLENKKDEKQEKLLTKTDYTAKNKRSVKK